MILLLLIAVFILSCAGFYMNRHLVTRLFIDSAKGMIFLILIIYSSIELVCGIFLHEDYIYISAVQPLGFLYAPLMYYLITGTKVTLVKPRVIFYQRLPFYIALAVYITFIFSKDLRDTLGLTFYKLWYSGMLLLWIGYFIAIILQKYKDRFVHRLDVFDGTMLILFLITIIIVGSQIYSNPQALIYITNSIASIFCIFLISLVIYLQQIDRLGTLELPLSQDVNFYFESAVLDFLNSDIDQVLKLDNAPLQNAISKSEGAPKIGFQLGDVNFLDNTITSQIQAELLGISASQLTISIKNQTGLSYPQYINKCRVDFFIKNVQGIEDPDYDEWMFKSGFNSKASFYRSFKKFTGKTPLEYFK